MPTALPKAARFRTLKGKLGHLSRALLISIPVLGVFFIMDTPSYLGWMILMEQYYGFYLGLVLFCIYLNVPFFRNAAQDYVPWYDWIFAVLGFGIGLYVGVLYPQILVTQGNITPDRVVLGTLAILLVLEALRRITGWTLPVVGVLFVLYARFTWLAPGMFSGNGMPWNELANYLYLDTNALFGLPIAVCSTMVVGFILFGNVLFGAGGGAFLSDFAISLFGRYRGGPAKMAVVASSLFGTLTGSPVANVITTGVVTIPLMKRTGYRASVAGAIEAVASTGGSLTPPIMGATAFVIAEFTGISYPTVALACIIPAVFYYLCVFVQVDLEAGKEGFHGIPIDQLPRVMETLKHSYLFVVPLGALIYALFVLNLSPGKSALLGVVSIFLLSFVKSDLRFRVAWLFKSLENTGRALLELSAIVAVAGFIMGIINFTGLGFIFPMILVKAGGENLYLLLLIVAAACILLGMGMPTVLVYILLAVLMGPALVELGIPILAAHLFIQYFGTLSQFTPPICLAAYTAASVSGAKPMKTAFHSMRIGVLAYPIPFLFVYSQTFLLVGSAGEIILDTITALAGCFLIGVAAVGYLFRNISPGVRVLIAFAGAGLLLPLTGQYFYFGLLSNIGGAGVSLPLLFWERRMSKMSTKVSSIESFGPKQEAGPVVAKQFPN